MSKSGKGLVCLMFAAVFLSSFSFAVTPDRIKGDLAAGTKIALRGNVHGLARPGNDLGRADGTRMLHGISVAFRPSPAQQKDLDQFIAQLGDRSSPNYHKYLTPKQFGERFGMSRNDLRKVTDWLQSQGFSNFRISNSRNQITFDGTFAQIESVFSTQMHNYLVDGEIHFANATNPSVPAAISDAVIGLGNIHDFRPKPRARVRSNFTSASSGNHFLSPGDFATIYDLQALYDNGIDGTGQKIAVVGQTDIIASDLDHFRSAAGLSAKQPTKILVSGSGTPQIYDSDLVETDLDLEWSGGVAKNATIEYVYVGNSQNFSVWDSLQTAVDTQPIIAPFITTSYGFCEAGLGSAFSNQVRGWATQAVSQGQTIVAASGDAGAADCESQSSTTATTGLAVDIPAAIPEVTGMGGTEFFSDGGASTTDTTYWTGASGSDTISSAKSYIPEEGWNDTLAVGQFSATGGGVSTLFSKPSWQTGTGVPNDGKRDVPDVSLTSSPNHDGYLFCSQTDPSGNPSCTSGFRDVQGFLDVVGGTSAASPSFAAILALINQYLGNSPPTGLAPVNPTLYTLAASNPEAFNDVTTGDNKVPCTTGKPDCPTGTTSIGFTAGAGYDLVTGLGSVNGSKLAQAWAATLIGFTVSADVLSPASVAAGNSATTTVTLTPDTGFTGTVAFSCSSLPTGATCSFNPLTVTASGTTQLTIQTPANMAAGTGTVTIKGASGALSSTTTVDLTVVATTESFTLTSNPEVTTLSVKQGQTTGAVNLVVGSSSTPSFLITNGSSTETALPLTYSCANLPSESTCHFSPGSPSSATAVTLTITTTAPTGRLQWPLGRESKVFYAFLLPGLMGIVFTFGSRQHSVKGMRFLAMIVVLGFSTLWLASCGGSSSSANKDPGTPVGTSTVTVNATTGGASPIASSLQFQLSVAQ